MEALRSLDSVFLAVEDRTNPMNVGTVAVFDGPVPTLAEARAFFARRITRTPRCRQRVCVPHGILGRPVWIDDVHFDLDHHVHAHSLAAPDGEALDRFVADLITVPLDRRYPLWNVTVVDGLADGRWALVAKVHHCMVDGIAGSDLLSVILEPDADTPEGIGAPWSPMSEPTAVQIAWYSATTATKAFVRHARGAVTTLAHPLASWRRARDVVHAARRLWYRQRHTPTSLVGPIGPRRVWAHLDVALDDIATIRAAGAGTVNDVVVAAVTLGFRGLLLARGEPLDERVVTAMVPVSLRGPVVHGVTGNLVANVHARLPVGIADTRELVRAVHAQLDDLKQSHEVDATGLLMRIGEYVPRFVADSVARRVVHRQRNVETVVTNVPGPTTPLACAGRRMVAGHPVAPIAGQVRTAVAIWSYCDRLHIGITADRDTSADIDRLADGIARGFADLRATVAAA